jgi:hypothetical protein
MANTIDEVREASMELGEIDELQRVTGEGLNWTVYKDRLDGQILEPGEKAGSVGPYITRITGELDLPTLAGHVGPGRWRLYPRIGKKLQGCFRVVIAGVPWPESAFNRQQPLALANPPAPGPEMQPPAPPWGSPAPAYLGGNPTNLRDEIRAALREITPYPPMGYAPPAPPADPLAMMNMALAIAEKIAGTSRATDSLSGLFESYVGAFNAGRREGVKLAGNGSGEGPDALTEVIKAALPLFAGARIGQVVTAPPPGTMHPAGGPPAGTPVAAATAPVPPAAAVPVAWGVRDHVVSILHRMAEKGGEYASAADAVEFYLSDELEFDAFVKIGSAHGFTDQAVRAGLIEYVARGSASWDMAWQLSQAPTAGDMIRQIQVVLEADDDDTAEKLPTERIPPAL